jgi:hypothetical protein
MTSDAPQFRVVYRGLAEEMAQHLLKENVFMNKGFTDTTVNPWNTCEPLDMERRETHHNLMVINLPEGARGLYMAEQEMIVLQRHLTLKCIRIAMFNAVPIAPDRGIHNIRMFAMEMKSAKNIPEKMKVAHLKIS